MGSCGFALNWAARGSRVIVVPALLFVSTVTVAAVLGAAAGPLVPGVVARVPAGGPVLAGPAPGARPAAGFAVGCGLLCALLAVLVGPTPELPAYLYLAWVGLALAVIDVGCHRLPDALTLPSYPIALVLLGAAAAVGGDGHAFGRALAGMAVLGGFYRLLAALPAGLGGGDVKLGGVLGLYLGWAGWPALAVGTFAAFVTSSAVAAVLIASGRATRKTALPFGPYMLVGALIGLWAGDPAAARYLG